MVADTLAEGAGLLADAALLGHDVPTPYLGAMAAGALAGVAAPTYAGTAVLSAIFGAAIPKVFQHGAGAKTMAMSAVTSTAVGLVTHSVKLSWLQQQQNRDAQAQRSDMEKWMDSNHHKGR